MFKKTDLAEGKKLLAQNKVKSLQFSEGTYQVEVDTFWPFLQLNDKGDLLDGFCTCETAEKKGACPHLAAAYLRIINEEPLHVRFRESLWNQIGRICLKRHGDNPKLFKRGAGRYEAFEANGKRLFLMQPKGAKAAKELETLLYKRPIETEETSLKFSNLDPEEISLWREGRPSFRLSYELSFWADLAKRWFLAKDYTIHFSNETPPQVLKATFDDMSFEFELEFEANPEIIPSLQTVESPLKVHAGGALESISFSKETGEFFLEFKEEKKPSHQPGTGGIAIGQWLFYPKEGFYAKHEDPLLEKKRIAKSEANIFLNTYPKLIQKYLTTENISPQRIALRTHLYFDSKQSLRLEAYLFEKGDLQKPTSHYFGNWAYIEELGFYPLEPYIFEAVSVTIPRAEVAEFINRYRVWLQGFGGFQTHVTGVESHLGFGINQEGKLIFFTRHEFTEEAENILDFGEWIYVEGKGFYAKLAARPGAFLKAGMEVASHEISSFIHEHREELEPIPKFFATQCPLVKSGLNIDFDEQERIQITPEFFFSEHIHPDKVSIFGDYTFVEGEGFSLIPHSCRLPDSYKAAKTIDPLQEPYFVSYELELLYPHALSIDPKLKRPKTLSLRLQNLKREATSKTGQWVLDLMYESDVGQVSAFDLWQASWQGKQYLFSEAGLILLRQRRLEWLRLKGQKRWLHKGASLRLTTLEFLRLFAFEEILEPQGESKKAKASRRILHDFLNFRPPTEPNLTGLSSDLRPYQKVGVYWLWFLKSYGLCGLLCDEMGLGKTHQAMALIAATKNASPRRPKVLVVCPTSVIYHWENLIKTFLPTIRPYTFHGIGRRFEAFSEDSYDLLLTSYGIVRTENKALSTFRFDLAIFDELQIAKNEKSLTHKSLRKISAAMRLGLTGTPIENRLLELKSLFDLVLPQYLPSLSAFRQHFITPIEKYQDADKKRFLSRLIHPFLLRRKKSEVLTELPEKIEEIALCDLSSEQQHLYTQMIQKQRDALLQDLRDPTKPSPISHIFALLSSLKQICNHPALAIKDIHNYKKHHSGKWELFEELLEETRDSGQKLVVFTQYLGMLDIMGLHLKEKNIAFAEIRGSTRDRRGEVKRFAEDPNCVVFLGSLQAAGVGIDLISASVVIHYDRWWNPAKENQATDRVHRMGQTRGVQVFKLVTKNTIEEHIHTLIEQKLSLAKGVIGFDEHDQIKGLSREDLVTLLQMLG